MSIRVALQHETRYRFDRAVSLFPHEVRLRPAPHARTPVTGYSLNVRPARHFVNWQQDAYGNHVARLAFPEPATELSITVDLVADMTVINPFDFFVEPWAEAYPFALPRQLREELAPYLAAEPAGTRLRAWVEGFRADLPAGELSSTDLLVRANRAVQRDVAYLIRMEPGVQDPETTLDKGSGSCRDSAWLLVNALRHLGLAARFVSGYLIQLRADQRPLDGPPGPEADFTDLHAWCEAYLPGAGWVGLDPTSGLFAGEGHIPLATGARPASVAAIIGATSPCDSELEFAMRVQRVHEQPRVTQPYTEAQWSEVRALGRAIDAELRADDVRLTQGGEPTFVALRDMESAQWTTEALGPDKLVMADALLRRLAARFGRGALLHHGQGKWYPGESLPRWALRAFWRRDGRPVWRDPRWLATVDDAARAPTATEAFGAALCEALDLDPGDLMPAWEDPLHLALRESRLPLDSLDLKGTTGQQRAALLARVAAELDAASTPAGHVLPLHHDSEGWRSSRWRLRRPRLELLSGDSPLGLRLPLDSLGLGDAPDPTPDPFAPRPPLPETSSPLRQPARRAPRRRPADTRTALCLQRRDGLLHVFLPPLSSLEAWLELVGAIEDCARRLRCPVRLEGYPPPRDPRLLSLAVTPDPGVIEVNIHPAADWGELEATTEAIYAEARACGLGAEKFMLDGRHSGTGGGNHVTLGGPTAGDSPFLRRPDLLRSLLACWQRHPALSYLFSGLFVGPTSQAPRVDEARDDALYELGIAFAELERHCTPGHLCDRPWLVDRLLRNHLVDLTGNTHRSEFCIDKLYAPDSADGRLGLLELRAFEMPPHPRMSLVQSLLLRALVARYWRAPDAGRLIPWGTGLHDRFMLPHFVEHDLHDLLDELRAAGYAFDDAWFAPFLAFRFPRLGQVVIDGIEIELRQAIEPWHVLGEESGRGGTARYVDSSLERLQVRVRGLSGERHAVTCNGRPLPLFPTGVPGEAVAGVRFKAWAPASALHPGLDAQGPLVFDLVDRWSDKALGGCTYHVAHPGGRNYATFPVNAQEAEARRRARFWDHGHSPGPITLREERCNPALPLTLDLRLPPA